LQKLMLDTAAAVMKEIVRERNGKDKRAEPGISLKSLLFSPKHLY
jgi:hypothetical protein